MAGSQASDRIPRAGERCQGAIRAAGVGPAEAARPGVIAIRGNMEDKRPHRKGGGTEQKPDGQRDRERGRKYVFSSANHDRYSSYSTDVDVCFLLHVFMNANEKAGRNIPAWGPCRARIVGDVPFPAFPAVGFIRHPVSPRCGTVPAAVMAFRLFSTLRYFSDAPKQSTRSHDKTISVFEAKSKKWAAPTQQGASSTARFRSLFGGPSFSRQVATCAGEARLTALTARVPGVAGIKDGLVAIPFSFTTTQTNPRVLHPSVHSNGDFHPLNKPRRVSNPSVSPLCSPPFDEGTFLKTGSRFFRRPHAIERFLPFVWNTYVQPKFLSPNVRFAFLPKVLRAFKNSLFS